MTFLNFFEQKYKNLLGNRYTTFYNSFKYLESLNKQNYFIIETGTARIENNFGDGQSTIIFDEFLNFEKNTGKLVSIDINLDSINFAKSKVSSKTELICNDSVEALYKLSNDKNLPHIDMLYLDSFDLDWNNPHPSSMHHVKELLSIMPKINHGTLIVIDDNQRDAGKGKYISEFMKNIKKDYYFNEYQTGWIF